MNSVAKYGTKLPILLIQYCIIIIIEAIEIIIIYKYK